MQLLAHIRDGAVHVSDVDVVALGSRRSAWTSGRGAINITALLISTELGMKRDGHHTSRLLGSRRAVAVVRVQQPRKRAAARKQSSHYDRSRRSRRIWIGRPGTQRPNAGG